MTTKSRAEALGREVAKMRGQRHHQFRRADGARLVLGAGALLDAFFRIVGGERSGLSERATRFLADVPVNSRMSDAEALTVTDARGRGEE